MERERTVAPVRVSEGGSFRFNRVFGGTVLDPRTQKQRPKYRVTRASGVTGDWSKPSVQREWHRRNDLLTKIYKQHGPQLLVLFQDGELEIEELLAADRENRLDTILIDREGNRPLWKTWEDLVEKMRTSRNRPISQKTKDSYLDSMRRLKRVLPEMTGDTEQVDRMLIGDLGHVDWAELFDGWEMSAAAWNHIVRAVSRFLTSALGDKFHPMRRAIVAKIPRKKEIERVSTLTQKLFYRILAVMPERWHAAFIVMTTTGLRVGELCALTEKNLDHENFAIRVVDSKTEEGLATVYSTEGLWPYVIAAIPVPVTHWHLRKIWGAAIDAAFPDEKKDYRIHDLRHLTGQTLSDSGIPEAKIQTALRHADPSMTRRYTKQQARRETATAIEQQFAALLPTFDEARRMMLKVAK